MGCASAKAAKNVPKTNVSESRREMGVTSMEDALKFKESRRSTFD
jgi:hypothetical protein